MPLKYPWINKIADVCFMSNYCLSTELMHNDVFKVVILPSARPGLISFFIHFIFIIIIII